MLQNINTELNQFWDEVTDTKKYVVLEDQVKETDKEKVKIAEKATVATQLPPAPAVAAPAAPVAAASDLSQVSQPKESTNLVQINSQIQSQSVSKN